MAAVAHVAAEDTGVGFVPQPGQQLFYDEAAACLHMVEGRMITAVALPTPMYAHAAVGSGPAAGAAAAGGAGAGGSAASPSRSSSAGGLGPGAPGGPSGGIDPSGYESDTSSIQSCTSRAFLVSEGPPVRLIRASLDGAFTALHRSARLVEFHCHLTGCMFVETAGVDKQGRKGGDPTLLGFFWTPAHFVMVTAGGLEVHSVHPSLQALRLDATVPLQGVQWYTYSPETHMVVLGFGSSGAKLQAVQFSKAGTLRLPMLDLTPPWGSPIRPVVAAAVSAALDGFAQAQPAQPARLVGPDTCWIVVLYGRVYACHHDRRAGVLRLYRMFRDATSLAHQYDVFAQQLELSVVDNVLLVHHIDSAVVMLVDIMAAGTVPISSPLPLAVPLADGGHEQLAGGSGTDATAADPDHTHAAAATAAELAAAAAGQPPSPELPVSAGCGLAPAILPPPPPAHSHHQLSAATYALHYPSWLVDGEAGIVYRLQLDLRAIADSQSDHPHLLAFLQRRRASSAPRQDAAAITLRVLRGLMQEEAPLGLLRGAFEVVNSFAAEGSSSSSSNGCASEQPPQQQGAARAPRPSPRQLASHHPRPIVLPQDMHNSAFALLRAQQSVRPAYLQAAVAEYLASCHAHVLAVAPSLAALYVDVLVDQGLPHLVAPLLLSHAQLDSVLLAEHVEEAAASGKLPGGTRLAEQLLLRIGAHEARCRLLLRHGQARRALLLAKQKQLVGQLEPAALLEAAAESGEMLLFAATHRSCTAQSQRGAAAPSLAEAAQAHAGHLLPAQLRALQSAGA